MNNLHINWFDLVAVAVIVLGFFRGRKNGMSEEMLITLQWLGIVFAGGFFYRPVGDYLAKSTAGSTLTGYIVAYLVIAMLVKIIFGLIKKGTGGKIISADRFGRSEYYLGMISGCVRFACVLIAILAVLNARLYTDAEVAAKIKSDKDVYGDSFFPTIASIQKQVFKESMVGSLIRQRLGFLLITPTHFDPKDLRGPAKHRDDVPPGL